MIIMDISAVLHITGSHATFQRVYEDPIVLSRQPTATPEEKEVGETRAHEVWETV